jgi:predicted SprT family Zn-dependent metalloprotease
MLPTPQRISLKFTHAREDHINECTTCHIINITTANNLRGSNPVTPVTSCYSCHKTTTDAVTKMELDQKGRDASFVCVKCHTSEIGKRAMPASHDVLRIE